MDNFFLVARQVAILFVLMGVGFACRKAKLIDEFSIRGMVNILMLVITPAIVVDSFQRPFDPQAFQQLGIAFLIAILTHAVAMAIALMTVRGEERDVPVLRLAMVFSNAGFMGIPLEHAILGNAGVFYGIVYIAVFNIVMWSWGLMQMSGNHGKGGLGAMKMLVNPGTVGLAIGLPLFLFSATLPEIIGTPVHAIAEINTPLAMMVLGYYLAGADFGSLVMDPAVYGATLMRLVVIPLMVVGGLFLVRRYLDRTMALAMVAAASAPVAAMVAIFASKYRRNIDMAVGLVTGTTVLSAFTMPVVLAVAMKVL